MFNATGDGKYLIFVYQLESQFLADLKGIRFRNEDTDTTDTEIDDPVCAFIYLCRYPIQVFGGDSLRTAAFEPVEFILQFECEVKIVRFTVQQGPVKRIDVAVVAERKRVGTVQAQFRGPLLQRFETGQDVLMISIVHGSRSRLSRIFDFF